METLKKGSDQVQKICEALKKDALEPAQKEATSLLEAAKKQAKEIVETALKEKEKLLEQASKKIEEDKRIATDSISQALKQSMQSLRQEITDNLFDKNLSETLKKEMSKKEVVAHILQALLGAIEKEGVEANLEACVSKNLDVSSMNVFLGKEVLEKLKNKSVVLGSFEAGAEVKWIDNQITFVLTDEALKELLGRFLRKDFRNMLFGV